jgi:GxxExxY protein
MQSEVKNPMAMDIDELANEIISAAGEVHRTAGPGLHEAEYEECLCYELNKRRLRFERNRPLSVMQKYKGQMLDCGYKLDLVVEDAVGVELKYCEKIESLHKSRLQAFLKLSGLNLGLLVNFNVTDLQDGIVQIKNHQHK